MSSLISRPIERGAVDGGPVVERPSVVSVTDETRDWNFSLRATKSVSQFTCKDYVYIYIYMHPSTDNNLSTRYFLSEFKYFVLASYPGHPMFFNVENMG